MKGDDEVPTVTAEIPVSLDRLSLVHRITLRYMRIKGLFYVLIGLSWIIAQSPSRLAGIEWLDFLSSTGVGSIWIAGGLIPIIVSYTNRKAMKRLGWFLLIFVPTVLGMYFFISWAIYFMPFISAPGYQRASITTISYWAYGASAYLMATAYNLTSGIVGPGEHHGRK